MGTDHQAVYRWAGYVHGAWQRKHTPKHSNQEEKHVDG